MPPYQGGGGMINEVKKENITFAESPTKFEAGTMQTAEVVAFSESIKFIKKIGLDKINEIVNDNFDLSPSGLIENLDLFTPNYLKTASYGHFGRENLGFKWEEVKDL